MKKRENNLVLLNAPENGKQHAQERQNVHEVKFTSFCINDLQLPADCSPDVDKVIRLWRPSTEPDARPRPFKVLLKKVEGEGRSFDHYENWATAKSRSSKNSFFLMTTRERHGKIFEHS